jgi:hypothetical protein
MAARDIPGSVLPAESQAFTKQVCTQTWHSEASEREVLLLGFFVCLIFLAIISSLSNPLAMVDQTGDNGAYIRIASAIQTWDFSGVSPKLFWGLPYAIAALSFLTDMPGQTALLMISLGCSFLALLFAYRLWGGWVAAFFAIVNFDWIARSVLGGAEPLFVTLLFGSFLLMRKQRWVLAALLAGLATVVRPVGVFALLGIGITLLWRREYLQLAWSTFMGLAVGGLYILPMMLLFRSPLANVHAYQQRDWTGGTLIDIPFRAIVHDTIYGHPPATNLALTTAWMLFVLLGMAILARRVAWRELWKDHAAEAVFFFVYVVFLFTYNSGWARADFPRFAIPVLPFALMAVERYLPHDRRILWIAGALGAALAACSTLGIRNVAEIVRKGLGS